MTLEAALALTRFGFGARPGDLQKAAGDPHAWLRDQTTPGNGSSLEPDGNGVGANGADRLISSADATMALFTFLRERRGLDRVERIPLAQAFHRQSQETFLQDVAARTNRAISGPDGFRERLVHFWTNHFTISVRAKTVLRILAGSMEREAIRPHVMGRFEDMLLAVTTHPAMLIYLDNFQSVGPASRQGMRRNRGLNENHAREILELHTLGVDGGYTQADVEGLARILTGWTIDKNQGTFRFAMAIHEPGTHTMLGKTYDQQGEDQGRMALRDLARHPATARHIARKLAIHMHSDTPPDRLVRHLERRFLDTGGDLSALSQALIEAPEMWDTDLYKIKTPKDLIFSALRALGVPDGMIRPRILKSFNLLGQRPFSAPSPAGWPDTAQDWASPNALKQRLEWANTLSHRIGRFAGPPLERAETVLGPLLSNRTRTVIDEAMDAEQGLTLFLMSPDFQRR